jgi:hypothetical protein
MIKSVSYGTLSDDVLSKAVVNARLPRRRLYRRHGNGGRDDERVVQNTISLSRTLLRG